MSLVVRCGSEHGEVGMGSRGELRRSAGGRGMWEVDLKEDVWVVTQQGKRSRNLAVLRSEILRLLWVEDKANHTLKVTRKGVGYIYVTPQINRLFISSIVHMVWAFSSKKK